MLNNLDYAIEMRNCSYRYGRQEAISNVSLSVEPGLCHAIFGLNGAGKTTTMKCLLGLLRSGGGTIRIFGHDPLREGVLARSRIAYVPDSVSYYPWMTIEEVGKYTGSFFPNWDQELFCALRDRFHFDPKQKAQTLSRGQKVQLALIGAIATRNELLILDEPTSGLDPLHRREFIQTIIGVFQEHHAEGTVFLSTHLISEFEGIIDEFSILDHGRVIISSDADEARAQFKRLHVRLPDERVTIPDFPEIVHRSGALTEQQIIVSNFTDEFMNEFQQRTGADCRVESMTLEEIFMAMVERNGRQV